MDEAHLLEERRLVTERNFVCRAEREVVGFPLPNGGAHARSRLRGRLKSRRPLAAETPRNSQRKVKSLQNRGGKNKIEDVD